MSADSTLKTFERIVRAALGIFLSRGVKGLSLNQVALEAGVTRVTVYRYFGHKKGLIRGICMSIAAIFQRAAEKGRADSVRDIDARLSRLGTELNELPRGNLLARFDEVRRQDPEVYEEFRNARQHAVDAIFQQALSAATREGTLRGELRPQVLKAIFWAAVVGLIENPALVSSNVSLAEVFTAVTTVFRHGILKEQPGGKGS